MLVECFYVCDWLNTDLADWADDVRVGEMTKTG